MLSIILKLLGPILEKIVGGLFRDNADAKLWTRLVGDLAGRIPDIMDKHGEDVKFADIDFQSLKAKDWDDIGG